ncbi:MAG: STM4013/SEN3800 family hydrolase [Anaerolineae bacterium]|nr:STM4013/SEN3800 family hydrolase [Anaerolineae bacterium]
MQEIVGKHDILFITLDTLRYDAACDALGRGLTPNIAAHLPDRKWEERHSPGSFTYAAHQAFFAGFLPTPALPGKHPRLFAANFPGSETTAPTTYVFDTPDIVTGLASAGYHTICIGGVGFFNKQSALGSVLPGLFIESHWSPALGVTNADSTANQIDIALKRMRQLPPEQRLFLFINISALHQPNKMYQSGALEDSYETHLAALAYVDSQLLTLFDVMRDRHPTFVILCSDHGTAYGEDGYSGHRVGHPVVWTVPYAEFMI